MRDLYGAAEAEEGEPEREVLGGAHARLPRSGARVPTRAWTEATVTGGVVMPGGGCPPGGASKPRRSAARPFAPFGSGALRVDVLRRRRRRLGGDGGQRRQALLGLDAADLAGVAEPRQARDLALALDPRRVTLGQPLDEPRDAVADLEREVRRRGAHELAHVVDRDLVVAAAADRMLCLGHGVARTASPAARARSRG